MPGGEELRYEAGRPLTGVLLGVARGRVHLEARREPQRRLVPGAVDLVVDADADVAEERLPRRRGDLGVADGALVADLKNDGRVH